MSRARILGVLPWLVMVTAPSQSQSPVDPNARLALAAKRIEDGVERQQRFICDAVISREFYRTDTARSNGGATNIPREPRGSLMGRDRLHVEVAVFDDRQLFSWPGTGTFHFEGLDEMTGGGTSGTGDFGSFAASFLADSDPASVRFRGVGEWAGRQVAEYSYDVPLVRSHYTIATGPHQVERAAYQGSMFVDTRTGDLRRLVIRVPGPPAASGILRAEVDTSYAPQPGTQGPDLFPSTSALAMLLNGGSEAINRTTYRGCHFFTSESTLHFGAFSSAPPKAEEPATSSRLPAGLDVRSTMLALIDSRTAYAGDLLEARVVNRVKQGKRTLVPKGAVLHGRIVRLQQQYYPRVSVRVGVRFTSVEFDGMSEAIALASRGSVSYDTGFRPQNWPVEVPEVSREPEQAGQHIATIWAFGKDCIRFDSHTVWRWKTH